VHSYHPLERSGIQNWTRNWSSLSWILWEFNEKSMYLFTYTYTMINVFIIELKQFVFCNVRTLMLIWWSTFGSGEA
jgi:hypothetical protein